MLKLPKGSHTHFWLIEGYRSERVNGHRARKQFYEKILPLGVLSEKQAEHLLQRLFSRHLNEDEIVSASLRRNAKGRSMHLDIFRDTPPKSARFGLSLGHDPHYRMTVWARKDLEKLR